MGEHDRSIWCFECYSTCKYYSHPECEPERKVNYSQESGFGVYTAVDAINVIKELKSFISDNNLPIVFIDICGGIAQRGWSVRDIDIAVVCKEGTSLDDVAAKIQRFQGIMCERGYTVDFWYKLNKCGIPNTGERVQEEAIRHG